MRSDVWAVRIFLLAFLKNNFLVRLFFGAVVSGGTATTSQSKQAQKLRQPYPASANLFSLNITSTSGRLQTHRLLVWS